MVKLVREEVYMALLITFISGLFTLIGSLIIFVSKNNKKIVDFSVSIGFGVLFSLIILDLIPETVELIQTRFQLVQSIFLILLMIIIGVLILKLLDKYIPDHDSNKKGNLVHIGIMTSVALCIHNFIEGMAIYTSLSSSLQFGSMLAVGVAFHNIPLGMSITSLFYKNGKENKKAIIVSILVSSTTILGGLLMFIFSGYTLNEFIRGIILAITLGMLIYIILFELLPHILENKNKKSVIVGISLGVILLLISSLF